MKILLYGMDESNPITFYYQIKYRKLYDKREIDVNDKNSITLVDIERISL